MNRKLLAGVITIEGLAFMLLEGSIITLGLIVAPRVFRTIESADLAGRVFGSILGIWVWLGMACTFVLLASAIWTAWQTHFNRFMLVRIAVLAVMSGIVIWFGTVVSQITTIQASLTKPIEQYTK